MIWSGVADIETLRDCFLLLCLYKNSPRYSLYCVVYSTNFHKFSSLFCATEINLLCASFFFFLKPHVNYNTLLHISYNTLPETSWVYRPKSKPSRSAVCFRPSVDAFMTPPIGNDTQLHVIKLHTFLLLLQHSLFSFLQLTQPGQ